MDMDRHGQGEGSAKNPAVIEKNGKFRGFSAFIMIKNWI